MSPKRTKQHNNQTTKNSMFLITTFSLTKLNNAEFVGYCVNLSNLIERAEATKLGLEEALVTEMASLPPKLTDHVYLQAHSTEAPDHLRGRGRITDAAVQGPHRGIDPQ